MLRISAIAIIFACGIAQGVLAQDGPSTRPAVRGSTSRPAMPKPVSGTVVRVEGARVVYNTAASGADAVEKDVLVDEFVELRVDGEFAKVADIKPGMKVSVGVQLRPFMNWDGDHPTQQFLPVTQISASNKQVIGSIVSVDEKQVVVAVPKKDADDETVAVPIDDGTTIALARRIAAGHLGDLRTGTGVTIVVPESGVAKSIKVTRLAGTDKNTRRPAPNMGYSLLKIEGKVLSLGRGEFRETPDGMVPADMNNVIRTVTVDENTEFLIEKSPGRLEDLSAAMRVNVEEFPAEGDDPPRMHIIAAALPGRSVTFVKRDGNNAVVRFRAFGSAEPQEESVGVDDKTRIVTLSGQRIDTLADLRPGMRLHVSRSGATATRIAVEALMPKSAADAPSPAP